MRYEPPGSCRGYVRPRRMNDYSLDRRSFQATQMPRTMAVRGGVFRRYRAPAWSLPFSLSLPPIQLSLGSVITAGLLLMAIFTLGSVFVFSLRSPNRTVQAAGVQPTPTAQDPLQLALKQAGGKMPSGKTTILLLGSDQRPEDGSFRTDVILLVLVDADKMKVSVVSFPRDLWVEKVPGAYAMKINMVQETGGFKAMAGAFEENFGVRPDHYVMTNFAGFQGIIDELGGIDVEIGQPLEDSCDLPQAVGGRCAVEPGRLHMDGQTALWYVRSRATSSDYDRLRRAQEVLMAVFARSMSLNAFVRIKELQAAYKDSVQTDLRPRQILSLLPAAAMVFADREKITGYAITEEHATPSWSWDGMWILLPDPEAIQGVLREAGFFE